MRRFFAFGCSYTSYSWPLWSNFLSLEYDEFYNWGLAGIGNRAIAERISEANNRHTFTKDDLIIVQWSSHLRNDWYHQISLPERRAGWKTAGSIFNYINSSLYDQKWVDTFFFEPAYLMHTLNNVSMTQGFLDSIGCEWYMTSIGDIRNLGEDLRDGPGYGEKPNENRQKIESMGENFVWDLIPELKFYEKKIWTDNSNHWLMPIEKKAQQHLELTFEFDDTVAPGGKFFDIHPSPYQSLLWLEQELKDKLNLSTQTLDAAKELAGAVHELHGKMRFNKEMFELALAKRANFPDSVKKMVWPGWPNGF